MNALRFSTCSLRWKGGGSVRAICSMAENDVDLFVIGGGSGGVRVARIAAGHGAKVMVAEEDRLGGTCVIRGCIPKKLFVYASRFHGEFEDAAGFGWTVSQSSFDWTTLVANTDREIGRLEAAYGATLEKAGVKVVKDRAALVDAHTVRFASGPRVRAGHVLIATGATPSYGEPIPGLEHVISSNEAFHLSEFPRRVLIQGADTLLSSSPGSSPPRLACHARLSRREHLAGLRRRSARAPSRRNGGARHQGAHWLQSHGRREGRGTLFGEAVRRQSNPGRSGDVRGRAAAEHQKGGWRRDCCERRHCRR
jgi:Pyridine nucleotide-disulphide oxidoreductase